MAAVYLSLSQFIVGFETEFVAGSDAVGAGSFPFKKFSILS
jgi:hypothetical protein